VGSYSAALHGKRIALGVTGSVAAVKSVEVARALMRHGADVIAVMTPAAGQLVHANLLEWATGNPVVTALTGRIEHVELGGTGVGRADLVLIAPATANTIGKIANGIDDTPVTSLVSVALGAGIPVVIAPGMHEPMYVNPLVLGNVNRLRDLGVRFVEPRIEEGKAKVADPNDIVAAVLAALGRQDWRDRRVLVTAGPTYEHLDPVRVLTNPSSGKMGIAIAHAARQRGARVTLVCGPTSTFPPVDVDVRRVETTTEMLRTVQAQLRAQRHDVLVMAAAPADYAPRRPAGRKITTREHDEVTLALRATPKIVDTIKRGFPRVFVVGFKAEHRASRRELVARGRAFLQASGADLVVVNDVGRPGVGFGADENEGYVVDRHNQVRHISRAPKLTFAWRLLDLVGAHLRRP
jgi:phosphopantothenoylcysteine decarboxylase/phosphopantothenate--cysteine ligase